MSVINQVLNQLELRGAQNPVEQSMVRAVPPAKRNFTLPLLLGILLVLAGIAAWQWMTSQRTSTPIINAPPPVAEVAVPILAIPDELPVLSAPASRLSFELSSVPLPSSLRPAPQAESKVLTSSVAEPAAPAAPVQPKTAALPQPKNPSSSAAKPAPQADSDRTPLKQVSVEQQADGEFRRAVALMQQGRISEALAGYQQALRLDAGHDSARQALVALLLENNRAAEAELVLQERLKNNPQLIAFSMLLARLQVESGGLDKAITVLEKSLPYATGQADYLAFLAALLQRQNRHEEAIAQYQTVIRLAPGNGIWLMGYGISLQAVKRNQDATTAYKQALATQTLTPNLQAFVQQKLKEL